MRGIKVGQIFALTIIVGVMTSIPTTGQSPHAKVQAPSTLRGTVTDITGARIPGATLNIKSAKEIYLVVTADDGTYDIKLPTGLYNISIDSWNSLSPARRAAFFLKPLSTVEFDFILFDSTPVMVKYDGAKAGEVFDDGPTIAYKYDVFSMPNPPRQPIELMIQYGERETEAKALEYRANVNSSGKSLFGEPHPGVIVTFDLMTIYANRVRFDEKSSKLEAEGNVVVADSKQLVRAKRVIAHFKKQEFVVDAIY